MAITKTLIANGGKGKHKFTLNVTETTTNGNSSMMDYSFILAPIQKGWDWADWEDKISYEIKFTEKVVNEETNEITTNELYKATGTIPAYNGSSTVVLSSGSDIEIEHDADGTKTIDISFKVTDNTGAAYTCGNASAGGSMILSALHTPPEITSVNISETNTTLTNLGVTNDTIVQYLSKKKFTITATTYDDAKISSYSIYHNNVLIGTSTTNEITIDFSNVNELMTSGTNYVGLTIAVIDDKGGYSTRIFNFPVIKYTKPTIESTSTTIKRKTSGGTVLTDNKVLLNFVGTCYKGNDVIGNANKPTVQYKIWNTTEPSYTTVSSTNTANVTVKDYEISNIVYTSVYDYKIKIYDVFTNSTENPIEKLSIIPTGVSVWTEYKDRVDFKKLTQTGINVATINDIQKHILQARINSDQILSWAAWTDVEVPLEEYTKVGNKLTFENNRIKIGAGVSVVRIVGNIRFDINVSNDTVSPKIKVYRPLSDGTEQISYPITAYYRKTAGADLTTNIPEHIISVEEGDYIGIAFQTGQANTNQSIKTGTSLIVEVIK